MPNGKKKTKIGTFLLYSYFFLYSVHRFRSEQNLIGGGGDDRNAQYITLELHLYLMIRVALFYVQYVQEVMTHFIY